MLMGISKLADCCGCLFLGPAVLFALLLVLTCGLTLESPLIKTLLPTQIAFSFYLFLPGFG